MTANDGGLPPVRSARGERVRDRFAGVRQGQRAAASPSVFQPTWGSTARSEVPSAPVARATTARPVLVDERWARPCRRRLTDRGHAGAGAGGDAGEGDLLARWGGEGAGGAGGGRGG